MLNPTLTKLDISLLQTLIDDELRSLNPRRLEYLPGIKSKLKALYDAAPASPAQSAEGPPATAG